MTTTMADTDVVVTGGVDTHRDIHVAAVLDERRRPARRSRRSPTTAPATGPCWPGCVAYGTVDRVGVEGTGSYGRGPGPLPAPRQGVEVVEVDRPNRQNRRRAGQVRPPRRRRRRPSRPRRRRIGHDQGPRRRGGGDPGPAGRPPLGAVKDRTAGHQPDPQPWSATAPDELREQLRDLTSTALIDTRCRSCAPATATTVPTPPSSPCASSPDAARHLERADRPPRRRSSTPWSRPPPRPGRQPRRRHRHRRRPARQRRRQPRPAPQRSRLRPPLRRRADRRPPPAETTDTASTAAATATPTTPSGASSWSACAHDPRTRAYVERRTTEGLSKPEIIRCLKRYVARELYPLLPESRLTSLGASVVLGSKAAKVEPPALADQDLRRRHSLRVSATKHAWPVGSPRRTSACATSSNRSWNLSWSSFTFGLYGVPRASRWTSRTKPDPPHISAPPTLRMNPALSVCARFRISSTRAAWRSKP